MVRPFRKPVIVMSPKALLRSPDAVSKIEDFAPGTTFKRVIGDESVQPDHVKRVLVCSGRHYYTLAKHRGELNDNSTAIIRIEEICPFPVAELQAQLNKYPNSGQHVGVVTKLCLVSLSLSLSLSLSISISLSLSISISLYLSIYLFLYLTISLSLSIYLFLYLSIYLISPFTCLSHPIPISLSIAHHRYKHSYHIGYRTNDLIKL
eukprot:sb/3470440/